MYRFHLIFMPVSLSECHLAETPFDIAIFPPFFVHLHHEPSSDGVAPIMQHEAQITVHSVYKHFCMGLLVLDSVLLMDSPLHIVDRSVPDIESFHLGGGACEGHTLGVVLQIYLSGMERYT